MEEATHMFALEEMLAGINDDVIANILPEFSNNVGYVPPNFNELYINWNLNYDANNWNMLPNLAADHLPININPVDDAE